MNEIVKYDNILNELNFKDFSENDFNLFMAICAKMRDLGEETQVFDYEYMMELMGWDRSQRIDLFHEEIKRVSEKLRQVGSTVDTSPDEFVSFNLFTTFRGNRQKRRLTVKVNPDFKYVLNDLTRNFTRFELREYMELTGRYTKMLYAHLKQYRRSGWWQIAVEDLRKQLSIPESMPARNIKSKVLNPSIELLRSCTGFYDLTVDVLQSTRRGRAVVGYKFAWTAEKQIQGQMNMGDYIQAQNNAKRAKSKNKFNDFAQHEYDFEQLEKDLLSN